MGKIDLKHIISELKERISLSQVVAQDTALKRHGSEYIGSCPLHSEKTASFFVNDSLGLYFCFGCKASGDVIKYITTKRNVNFNQAINILADMAGIQLEEIQTNDPNRKQLEILNIATEFYKKQLQHNLQILEYCKSRNISSQSIQKFQIGYSGDFQEMIKELQDDGYSIHDIKKADLDKFKNRLVFPILDKSGRTIAFGARSIDNSVMPKYINSSDSEIFHKQTVLYGYNIASRNVTRSKGFVIVEGYIDVVAMHQYGFDTAIASMGTSFSNKHIQQIWKCCDSCILCFDGDLAGRKASIRAAQMFLEQAKPGTTVSICLMPEGEDPASYLQHNGAKAMQNIVDGATTLLDFLWQYWIELYNNINNKTPELVSQWKKDIQSTLDRIENQDIKYMYVREYKNRIYKLLNAQYNTVKTLQQKCSVDSVCQNQKRLIYECMLLYTYEKCSWCSDIIIERLHEIEFSRDFTRNAQELILHDKQHLIDYSEITSIATKYRNFDNMSETEIETLVISVMNSLCSSNISRDNFGILEDDDMYVGEEHIPNTEQEWCKLKRIKISKIKQ